MWEKLLAVGTMIVGAAVVAVGGAVLTKTRELSKKFDKSVMDLEKTSEDEIKKELVETAVENAAKRKVDSYVDRVGDVVMASSKQEISDAVRKAVATAKIDMIDQVSERVSAEAALIDMDELKKSARDKAEKKILDKFDGNLDDLLGKFNENLGNVQRIYNGIAETFNKNKSDKEFKFTVG